ncbi:copper resistance protein B (plasmid) [Sphingobium limneticum]|jgi:copper resistance protein B|uniref:Copper resistance protein CopB n=3 Tax=Sphingomonadaceae TaxID=41297 RepID=A0A7X4K8F4_9SPHN|nr:MULTISPECIES: copper resistance protein B [Alphaproteobacteria]MCC4253883.1 copper resistance protein B [Sphingobium naphthae]MDE0877143.1 copper resistance protein B [Sphingomonas bacterium]AYO75546.1 copper resistance protein B [Sphingobium yanoikuyae]MDG2515310.1 copper resistance protein B [Sphingobium yanoikuyae]MYL99175.1 copper resistance protein CopB [Novosphingobium silvae]|tara:strand:- start:5906 stop:7117 length:1212 start_codon:yes stop_codon:yes gene_type:complete
MKTLAFLSAASVLALASPAGAQSMDHSQHQSAPASAADRPDATSKTGATACSPEHAAMGHCKPAPAEAKKDPLVPASAPEVKVRKQPVCAPEHAAMGHCTPAPDTQEGDEDSSAGPPPSATSSDPSCPPEHAAMGHCTPKAAAPVMPSVEQSGTALPAGNAPAPAAPDADYADRVWGRDAMKPVRNAMMKEHGGMSYSQVMLNLAEIQIRDGKEGYHWDGEAWFGGDINRLTVKSEGEGDFGGGLEGAEVQALYSRAIGPYFNLQAGVRQDIRPEPSRTYAVIGFEGLAPYWFEIEGAAFVSDKGDLLGRIEGYYDQRITQRLVAQPRAEVNLSAQDMRAEGIGSGLVNAELGLRVRYEIVREFAPYVGVAWERKFGETARIARAAGEDTGGFNLVAGVRVWF